MILNGKNRERFVTQTSYRLIIEIDMCNLDIRWQCDGVDREAVIMGRDLDFAGGKVFDRLIAASMAEF